MELHAQLAPLAGLVGTWKGRGAGQYPTIESFEYEEQLTFEHVGKPFLSYRQVTWSLDGAPMHTESGFLRCPRPGTIELTLAQPTGQTELAEGTLTTTGSGFVIDLDARLLNSATAKQVDATHRAFRLDGAELTVDFAMAAVGQPLTHHLASVLRRT